MIKSPQISTLPDLFHLAREYCGEVRSGVLGDSAVLIRAQHVPDSCRQADRQVVAPIPPPDTKVVKLTVCLGGRERSQRLDFGRTRTVASLRSSGAYRC